MTNLVLFTGGKRHEQKRTCDTSGRGRVGE